MPTKDLAISLRFLRMSPCNEKNQSNVVKCWASSQALSALPQTALQLELLHAHLKDISGSATFPEVSVGAGSRRLARSNSLSCLVHTLLMQVHNFHWHRLGVLVATKQLIPVQPESGILYLSFHQAACT